MIRVFEKSSPDFQRRLDALCNRSTELSADIEAAARRVIAEVRAGGDAAVRALTAKFDKRQLDALELPAAEWDALAAHVAPDGARGARARRARVRVFHERERHASYEISGGRRARRQPRRSAGAHRHLRAGRQGPLPVDGDHDRRPGARRRRARDRDDHARPVARDAGGRAAGRRRSRVRDRRRAGDRGAGLRDRERAARRQDRRPGQRLRRRGQAAGVRRRRHRFDRRPDRGRHRRRRQRRPALDRRRPAGPGRARRAGGPDPDRARQGASPTRVAAEVATPAGRAAAARDRRAGAGATRARSSSSTATTRSCAWSTGWRPSTRSWRCATRARWRRASRPRARCSSARTRPSRSATTSPAPATCCRPAAARASRRRWAWPTSSSGRRSSNTTPPRWRAQADDIERLTDRRGPARPRPRRHDPHQGLARRHEPGGDAARNDLPLPRSEGGARQGQRGEVGRSAGRRWPPTASRSGSRPSACWPR